MEQGSTVPDDDTLRMQKALYVIVSNKCTVRCKYQTYVNLCKCRAVRTRRIFMQEPDHCIVTLLLCYVQVLEVTHVLDVLHVMHVVIFSSVPTGSSSIQDYQ
jgi:hypothetical protein